MDSRAAKFDWNRARAFLVTAEAGSLSAAARALGMAQPTLSRQVAALEHELRVTLFERVGRGLELTDSGRALLEHVRGMGDAASRMALSAAGEAEPLTGTISIAAGELTSAFVLPPILARLRREHPALGVQLLDVRAHDAEIAIASQRPNDAALLVQRVRDLPLRYYAAPSYLKLQSSPPRRPKSPLAESLLVAWELVKHGLGIGSMLEDVGDSEPLVERTLPDAALSSECWLVAQREGQTSRRVRSVFEFLAAELR
jgi:DNA-binding transcriptional LysR family regulator